jgi:hypothetical protein
LRVARAFLRHAVEIRRLDELLAVAAEITLRQVVAEDENDVRLVSGDGGKGANSSEREIRRIMGR